MAHQFSYTNPDTGATSTEAYGRLDGINIVDVSEVFKTVYIDGVLTTISEPQSGISCLYKIYHDVEAKQNEYKPLKTISINIKNGYAQQNHVLNNQGDIISYDIEMVENTDAEGEVFLKWEDVFDGVTVDFSDRAVMRTTILSAIYTYLNTKVIAGVDLTEAISV